MGIEERADRRWHEGRKERGLVETDGFVGDPVEEFLDELADALNYLRVFRSQYDVPDEVILRASIDIHGLYTMAETMQRGGRRDAA